MLLVLVNCLSNYSYPEINCLQQLGNIRLCSPYTGQLLRHQEIIPYRVLFTLKKCCGGALSVTKRSCAAPISKVESHISD